VAASGLSPHGGRHEGHGHRSNGNDREGARHRARRPARGHPRVAQLFENIKPIDAVVSCAGRAAFRPLAQLNDDDFQLSLRSKLMGQVNLVRIGMNHVRDSGSFTLTGGVLAHEPMAYVAAIEGNYNGQTLDARKFV